MVVSGGLVPVTARGKLRCRDVDRVSVVSRQASRPTDYQRDGVDRQRDPQDGAQHAVAGHECRQYTISLGSGYDK